MKGFITLGKRMDGSSYNEQIIHELTYICQIIAISLTNTKTFEKIQ